MGRAGRLCIGTAQFGMHYGIANKAGKVSPENAVIIVRSAVESGITFFDTAQAYGDSEQVLGYAVKELNLQDRINVITKLPPAFDCETGGSIVDDVKASLENTRVNKLWGLMLHRAPRGIGFEAARKIEQLKKEGTIGNFGVSVYKPEDAIRFLDNSVVDMVQLPFNVLDRRWIDQHVFEKASQNNRLLFLRSIFLQGLLLMNVEELGMKGMDWARPYLSGLNDFVNEHGTSVPLFAMQAALQTAPEAKIVVGVETNEQMEENVRMAENSSVDLQTVKSWWDKVPRLPEKLLNPSLWSTNPSKKIVAIVQARMGSTRLPRKVLLPVAGHPMLWHIVQRLRRVGRIDEVMVATTVEKSDDPIAQFCLDEKILCFRGSENDVLDRFQKASELSHADYVVRITADCPLVDPGVIENLILGYFSGGYDHYGVATGAGVAKEPSVGKFPDGLDGEVFSADLLKVAWKEATSQLHREHVTPFLWQQPERFRIGKLKSRFDHGNLRLTVDNIEDFYLIRWIYDTLYEENPRFGLEDVLDLLEKNPDKVSLNKHYVGKEGYEEFWR